jgi:hypothetical protein
LNFLDFLKFGRADAALELPGAHGLEERHLLVEGIDGNATSDLLCPDLALGADGGFVGGGHLPVAHVASAIAMHGEKPGVSDQDVRGLSRGSPLLGGDRRP